MGTLSPMIRYRAPVSALSRLFSNSRLRCASAFFTTTETFSMESGFSRKSKAPSLVAFTAASRISRATTRRANLEIARAVLAGEHGPPRDIVLVNAAAALVAAGQVAAFLEGMAVAVVSIDSGAARSKVDALARFTHAAAATEPG